MANSFMHKTKPLLDLPEGETQIKNWGPVQLDGATKVLVLPDIHIPYHDRDALATSLAYGVEHSVDTVLINGDCGDFYQLSRFNKDPRMRHWVSEIKMIREFLKALRSLFRKARIVYKLGNHDERYEVFLQQNCAELIGLDKFEIGNVLDLEKHGVELVRDKRPIRVAELNIVHGHEYRFAISNPVNAARGLFLRTKAYSMCSHFHQKSEHSENNIEGKSIATWSTGCLCDLHPAYMPLNNWSHGFAFVEVSGSKFHVSNHKISHGKVY